MIITEVFDYNDGDLYVRQRDTHSNKIVYWHYHGKNTSDTFPQLISDVDLAVYDGIDDWWQSEKVIIRDTGHAILVMKDWDYICGSRPMYNIIRKMRNEGR